MASPHPGVSTPRTQKSCPGVFEAGFFSQQFLSKCTYHFSPRYRNPTKFPSFPPLCYVLKKDYSETSTIKSLICLDREKFCQVFVLLKYVTIFILVSILGHTC